ncbi:hypothetical protein QUC31_006587 [Theobroma cacao]|uniref:Oligosaccaryltransferase n=2 Tax=Theobroma cacao TaxID=3641 RepID=A0A061FNH8_THECC|nr:Oligosaccaryltransferase [Theobroma cacao]WRX12603.1 Oligosaccaryltransferase - like 1 [Theobroma cacao]
MRSHSGVDIALDSGSKGRGFESHCDRHPFNRFCILSLVKFSMIDDQQLGFLANFLGIFIFALVIAYHYVMADPKYDGN